LKKWLTIISIFALTTSILSACTNPKDAETIKYNTYADLSNMPFFQLESHLSVYRNYFGYEEELQLTKGEDTSKYTHVDIVEKIPEDFYNNIDQVLKLTTKAPSFGSGDETMRSFTDQLRSYMDTINEIADYYSSEKFAEDNFTQGRELHKKLNSQYNALIEPSQQIFADLKEITDRIEQQEMKELSQKKYYILYTAKRVIASSQTILQQFDEIGQETGHIEPIDFEKYSGQYTALSSLGGDIHKFLKYSQDEEQIKKEKIKDFAGFDKKLPEFEELSLKMMLYLAKSPSAISEADADTENLNSLINEFQEQLISLFESYNNMIDGWHNR
jgi:hypothetical protein